MKRLQATLATALLAFTLALLYATLLAGSQLFAVMRPIAWPGGLDLALPAKTGLAIGVALGFATYSAWRLDAGRALRVSAVVVAFSAYGWANLDWFKLLRGVPYAHGGHGDVAILLLHAAPFAAIAVFLLVGHRRLAARQAYLDAGASEEEAAAGARALHRSGLRALALAGCAWVGLAVAFVLVMDGPAGVLPAAPAGLAPLVVAAAGAVAIHLFARTRRDAAA